MNKLRLLLCFTLALAGSLAAQPTPVSTSFTYQGQLKQNGAPVNTPRDFRVTLYDRATSPQVQPELGKIGSALTKSCQQVANGLFTLTLNFPDLSANNCQGRWLEIEVATCGSPTFQKLMPRVELLPTPYALQSLMACQVEPNGVSAASIAPGEVVKSLNTLRDDVTLVGVSGVNVARNGNSLEISAPPGANIWSRNGSSAYYNGGNVGIGTSTPGAKLHAATGGGGVGVFSGNLNPFGTAEFESNVSTPMSHAHVWFAENGNHVFSVGPGGTVFAGPRLGGSAVSSTLVTSAGGLPLTQGAESALASFGLTTGNNTSLGVRARRIHAGDGWQRTAIGLTFDVDNDPQAGGGIWLAPGGTVGEGNVGIGTATPQAKLDVANGDIRLSSGRTITSSGRLHIQANGDLYLNPFAGAGTVFVGGSGSGEPGNLHVVGTASVDVLTIRGGADLAEPFQMSQMDIPQGAVVIIDEENPGQLKMSESAYDRRVAGIVSGANGVKAGITLHQEGLIEGGQNVALSGRVYVQADANEDSIKPGDLLTTSHTPGHAMKVADHAKAQGAILGKAMTGLKEGKGMVLVLVSLQ